MDTKFTSADLAKIKHSLKRQVLDAKLHKDSKTWGVMESGSPLTAGLGPLSDYPHSCDHYPVGTCHQDEIYDPNILVANRQAELALLKREIESKTLHEIITRILEREQFINDNSMSMEEDLSSGYSSLKSSPNSNYRYQPEQVGFQPLVIHRSSRIQELPFQPLHNESIVAARPQVVSTTRAMFRNQLEEPLRLNRNYGSGRFSRKPVITALV